MPDLLLELLSEEIPARMQARAAEDLRRGVTDRLVEAGLLYEGAAAHAGPRRLTLDLRGLAKATPARAEERKGPRADAPAAAVEGFLRSTGLTRAQLETREDRKGAVLFAVIAVPGRPAAEVVAEAVTATLRDFPWPKSMRWGAGSLRWVRPLRSILCLLSDEQGAEVVPLAVEGIESGAVTRGHRFMAPAEIRPRGFEDYAARLEAAKVVVSAAERAERILHDARTLAFAQGLELVEDPGLLAEVAGLVEWPVALMGPIEERFLALPPEVLRTSMKEHQKFFSVRNPATGRIERFVTVANIEAPDGGATILQGNRRVLAARLSDAMFFWENDLRTGIAEMGAPLGAVTFHSKLGTQAERVARIAALAREIAPKAGADSDLAERAARLCKADLASAMVKEFPELQGVMGRYYARAAGEPEAVADAIRDHYAPLGPSDAVPTAPVSVAVALADKLDMLAGFWAIDEKPTGSKDPFALRRAALGVIRIVLENGLRLRLGGMIASHRDRFVPDWIVGPDVVLGRDPMDIGSNVVRGVVSTPLTELRSGIVVAQELAVFVADRLKVALRDRGLRHDVIAACVGDGADDLTLLVRRAEALQAFLAAEDGANLLAGCRRASSILAQEEKRDGVEYSLDPDPAYAEPGPERALFAALDAAEGAIDAALAREDFAAAMGAMAGLRQPIDAFFEAVVVNADSPLLRRNRLCLLARVRRVANRAADFSAIEG